MSQLKCKCGSSVIDDDIYEWNYIYTNEEGEEYCRVRYDCEACGLEYEGFSYGECEDLERAKEILEESTSIISTDC